MQMCIHRVDRFFTHQEGLLHSSPGQDAFGDQVDEFGLGVEAEQEYLPLFSCFGNCIQRALVTIRTL